MEEIHENNPKKPEIEIHKVIVTEDDLIYFHFDTRELFHIATLSKNGYCCY